ncbi:hypothetical protein TSTA_000330 [Talaromyces stipitatus ATCC 10500]|uniref:Carboxymuconolactone decarboxylase-like domain-containing protein n=1 Tax=Talaromyces stipitatus (strain ATCC 10500 / CBS 375.48 / QM 6759 / NRRL 1006) TaxID=441959 RepID=B8MSG0_TALSN|nr:uncharacterized protein TSTA_000330 [Talaromyces stipitatus ATCC 10500]EED11955.1 hypothetical protein TSTA_000330 [Talaromyces stipitatus ATCC 10500]
MAMEPRFTIRDAPSVSTHQIIEESLMAMHNGPPPFQWIKNDGSSLMGCYAPLSYSPSVVRGFFEVARAVYGSVKPRNRELAILGLLSILDAPYVVYCHRSVASKVGITDEQYEHGLGGNVPNGLNEEEAMAYSLGRILTTLTGLLNESDWRKVISKLDKDQVVGIIHTIGGYRWVALLEQVNGEDRRWS